MLNKDDQSFIIKLTELYNEGQRLGIGNHEIYSNISKIIKIMTIDALQCKLNIPESNNATLTDTHKTKTTSDNTLHLSMQEK